MITNTIQLEDVQRMSSHCRQPAQAAKVVPRLFCPLKLAGRSGDIMSLDAATVTVKHIMPHCREELYRCGISRTASNAILSFKIFQDSDLSQNFWKNLCAGDNHWLLVFRLPAVSLAKHHGRSGSYWALPALTSRIDGFLHWMLTTYIFIHELRSNFLQIPQLSQEVLKDLKWLIVPTCPNHSWSAVADSNLSLSVARWPEMVQVQGIQWVDQEVLVLGQETKLVDQFDANERCCGCRRFFPRTNQWL